jgi:MFS family permease
MTPGAIVALGIGQCVNWGVLYYAFAVLVQPLERELGVSTWIVTGAFSLALLMSAALAPAIGRWCDGDRGAMVMQAGGLTAGGLLAAWTIMPGVLPLYVVWAGVGLCMAATLYEPAFVIVGRAFDDPARRLRALAAVTLFGGLASTVFLPVTALLVAALGWRGAVLVLAALVLGSTLVTRTFVFRQRRDAAAGPAPDAPRQAATDRESDPPRFLFIVTMFALASLAGAAFTSNLVPALGERGISPTRAAMLGGLIGVMQLPGRALLMNGVLAGSPSRLLAVSLLFQAAGLGAVAFAPSMLAAAVGTMVFALGAGLMTLARPHLIQAMFSAQSGGHLNGRIARQQQLARAAGPLAVAWLAGAVGYAAVFAVIGGAFAAMAVASQRALSNLGGLTVEKEMGEAREPAQTARR